MRKFLGIILILMVFLLSREFIKAEEVKSRVVDVSNKNLILVNKSNPLKTEYDKENLELVNVDFIESSTYEERLMQKEAAVALENLFKAAKINGIDLYANSGYRSKKTQETIYEKVKNEKGEKYANKYVARPSESEHQTGLVMDITNRERNFHEGSKEARWIEKNAHKYGFILRYLKGKSYITGYAYEPWHIRYVGTKASNEIYSEGITLEEYIKGII